MKNEYSPRRQERNQSFVCQALVALSLNVESISPHIESNTEQRWKLRFGNMSPLFFVKVVVVYIVACVPAPDNANFLARIKNCSREHSSIVRHFIHSVSDDLSK